MLSQEVVDSKVETVVLSNPLSLPIDSLDWWIEEAPPNRLLFQFIVEFEDGGMEGFDFLSHESIQKDDFHRKLSNEYEEFVRELWREEVVSRTVTEQ